MDKIPHLLKAFVIAGGVLLIAGTGLLVVLILLRLGQGERVVQPLPPILALPRGARVEQVVADGDRWLLLGTDGAGQQFLAVVDPRTGERVSLLWLQPEG